MLTNCESSAGGCPNFRAKVGTFFLLSLLAVQWHSRCIAQDGFARSSRLNHQNGAFGGGAFPTGGSFGGGGFRRSNSHFPISLLPINNGADQLWRIQTIQGNAGYCFESVLYPGMGLTCIPNQGLSLQNITYDPWQVWWPQTPTFVLPQPQFRTVQHQIVPNPPLRPISAKITNSHSDTLLVLVAAPATDPLKDLLNKFQKQRAAF